MRHFCVRMAAILIISIMAGGRVVAYSVLTHEEIVDLLWTDGIRPLLLKRFPALSEDEFREAHAYAYGPRASCATISCGFTPTPRLQ
jgi:hypothetical protein